MHEGAQSAIVGAIGDGEIEMRRNPPADAAEALGCARRNRLATDAAAGNVRRLERMKAQFTNRKPRKVKQRLRANATTGRQENGSKTIEHQTQAASGSLERRAVKIARRN